MKAFIICGYGIPEDIEKNVNYTTYLHVAFNTIYEHVAGEEAFIIACGGPTNCTPPFDGTEAELILDYLSDLADRDGVSTQTENWSFIPESKSLSTLENFLFAKNILDGVSFQGAAFVFCEKTREPRVKTFTEKIFGESTTVIPIDFDISQNRYLDPATIQRKEEFGITEGLWTLEDPERIEKHHAFFERKFAFIRKRQSEGLSHEDAVKEWFEFGPKELQELMPDHPLLSNN